MDSSSLILPGLGIFVALAAVGFYFRGRLGFHGSTQSTFGGEELEGQNNGQSATSGSALERAPILATRASRQDKNDREMKTLKKRDGWDVDSDEFE